jgi:hypothetical protein
MSPFRKGLDCFADCPTASREGCCPAHACTRPAPHSSDWLLCSAPPPSRHAPLPSPTLPQPADLLGSDGASDESVVRGVCRAVARRLAAAEAGELVRSMQAAAKLRAGGGSRGGGDAFGAEVW